MTCRCAHARPPSQTKKRYVGFLWESPKQSAPVFDAKGIETVGPPALPGSEREDGAEPAAQLERAPGGGRGRALCTVWKVPRCSGAQRSREPGAARVATVGASVEKQNALTRLAPLAFGPASQVRRDGCPAVSKMLEACLRVLFSTADLSLVRSYCTRQWTKILANRVSVQVGDRAVPCCRVVGGHAPSRILHSIGGLLLRSRHHHPSALQLCSCSA
jgi:hypothetical protein